METVQNCPIVIAQTGDGIKQTQRKEKEKEKNRSHMTHTCSPA